MTDLLPCPFCGGEASLNKTESGLLWSVLCVGCSVITDLYRTEAEVIEAWNRRKGDEGKTDCTHPRGYVKSVRVCGLCGEQL